MFNVIHKVGKYRQINIYLKTSLDCKGQLLFTQVRTEEHLILTVYPNDQVVEHILRHAQYITWCGNGSLAILSSSLWSPPCLELDHKLKLSKHPSYRSVPVDVLVKDYSATYFCRALA